jgi:hypothetical protein
MYINGKMIPDETILGLWEGNMEENRAGSAFKCNILTPSTIIKNIMIQYLYVKFFNRFFYIFTCNPHKYLSKINVVSTVKTWK